MVIHRTASIVNVSRGTIVSPVAVNNRANNLSTLAVTHLTGVVIV